jgi:DNA modification methylase
MKTNTIITGDSAEVLATFPPDCIDLTVTSPPYDNLRTYNGFTFDFERIARELYRVTKPGGVVVWVVADGTIEGSQTGTSFRQALYFIDCGFSLHDTMIWNKKSFTSPQSSRYPKTFEYMFILSKGTPKTFNPIIDRKNKTQGKFLATKRTADGEIKNMYATQTHKERREIGVRFNVWDIMPEQSNTNRTHPGLFPEALAADHILSWSNPGDLVLDCFAGSGTTLKKAKELGRDYIGIEISPEYVEIINRRLLATNPPLFVEGAK